jgi:hypothetical protein
MMDWRRELDALIESTIAFAKDVKPKPISNLGPVVRAEQPLAHKSKPILPPVANTPMTWPRSERDEILQRVSNFRTHQQKMAREREDYYLQAKAKMLSAIDPNPALSESAREPQETAPPR